MSNPNNFFSQNEGASGGGTACSNTEEEKKLREEYIRHQEQLIKQTLIFEKQGREFSYAWGVLNEAKALTHLESIPDKEKGENKDFRWDYFWMCFHMVHKPYVFEKEESRFVDDLELSTSIAIIPSIHEFIILIGEEICKGIAFINHWKFLREELYSLLNLGVESNPISAYVTHACELSSLNNEHPRLSVSEDSIEVTIPTGHVENLMRRRQDELSIAAIPMNFE